MFGHRLFLTTSLILVNISVTCALKNPDPVNEHCKVGEKTFVQPDPHPCRLESGTKCCNDLFIDDFKRRRTSAMRDYLAKKRYYAPDPSQPDTIKPAPVFIDFRNFDIFESMSSQGPWTYLRRPDKSSPDRLQTFYIVCVVTLSQEALAPLMRDDFHILPRSNDGLTLSRQFRVKCALEEIVDQTEVISRQQWALSDSARRQSTVKIHDGKISDARCKPISAGEWWKFQDDLNTRERRGSALTRQKHAWERELKRQRIVEAGGNSACLELPIAIGYPAVYPNGLMPMYPAPTMPNNDPNNIAWTVPAFPNSVIHTTSADSALSEESSTARQNPGKRYADAIAASEFEAEWDYPELYDTAEPAPVQQISLHLVSRNTNDLRKTVVASAVGPTSQLPTRVPEPIIIPDEDKPAVVEGVDWHACITTMLEGPPVTLSWTEFEALPELEF